MYIRVSKSTFWWCINLYPKELERGCTTICEPSIYHFGDSSLGGDYWNQDVAQIYGPDREGNSKYYILAPWSLAIRYLAVPLRLVYQFLS